MGTVYRPVFTRALPAGAVVVRRDGKRWVEIQGKFCEVRAVKGRDRVFVESDSWAVAYQSGGKTVRTTIGPDKRMAQAALARFEEREARARVGLPDHAAEAAGRGRLLAELLDEYLAVLAASDTTAEYRATTRQHLTDVRESCGWTTWADVGGDALRRHLGHLRDTPRKKGKGLSPATLNGYLRSWVAFGNWYAKKIGERNPLEGVPRYAEDADRRRSRRILTDDEFAALLAAALKAPRRHGTRITPSDRVMLYRTAAYTGLRADELARLTPASFALDADPPAVTVYGKGKRLESVTLPPWFADMLRPWLAGKAKGARLWPGKWAEQRRQAQFLGRDVKRAGLGEGVHFHSLRRKFVTDMVRSGIETDLVRRAARHRDVKTTLNHYAVSTTADLKRAADVFKPT